MSSRLLKIVLLNLIFMTTLFARWGWGSHRAINAAAVDCLPQEMAFFAEHRGYLTEHAIDPDTNGDPNPGYYHYIDIDYYDEFFTGELPHEWQAMIDLYGQSTVNDVGIVPWVIDWWLNDLSGLMLAHQWEQVWQVAAELGHYVADSHQALHLTQNYNGQLTGNYGIHSRYESEMMNRHLDNIILWEDTAEYWEDPLDSIFAYIGEIYPLVDLIMDADDVAYAQDPNHGNEYYDLMWSALGDTSSWSFNMAVIHVADLWYTAWIDAGSPDPNTSGVESQAAPSAMLLKTQPNPFNSSTTIHFQSPASSVKQLNIYDTLGRKVVSVTFAEHGNTGSWIWDGRDQFGKPAPAGVYMVHVSADAFSSVRKISLIN